VIIRAIYVCNGYVRTGWCIGFLTGAFFTARDMSTIKVRCLLSSGIDFVQYPVYYPDRFAHINLNSFAPSPIQCWGLVPLDILTNDEYARRQLDSSLTLEVYRAPDVNDSLHRAEEME
jgi:hypothetical protein